MILFKNVDICDLETIMKEGILPISKTGNDNWNEGRRADNSRDIVYLFSPIGELNTFPQYGIALLEIDIPDDIVTKSQITKHDVNFGKYKEYICSEVSPEYIKAVYIPEIFRDRIDIGIDVSWCGMEADIYDYYDEENKTSVYKKCDEYTLKKFSETTTINSVDFNFFRGENADRTTIDLYNVRYVINEQ